MPKLTWNPDLDPESEDRLHFLSLSYQDRMKYMMKLIMLTYPADKVTNNRKRIEWT